MRSPLVVSAVMVLALAAGPSGSPAHRPPLFKDSRQAIAMIRAQGRTDVVLLVAARQGKSDAVAREAARAGGDVRFRDDEVGYLRVRVPIDRATVFAGIEDIEAAAVDVDDRLPIRLAAESDQGQPPAGQPQADAWPPRLSDYPLRKPYSPLKDIGADALRTAHPTWDGRGVTIALLDGNLDLLLPEFQRAYTLDGRAVSKIADFLNATDPRDDFDNVPQWVDMRTVATTAGGKLTIGGKTFTAPRDGTYRTGVFSERRFNNPGNAAYIDQDIDRDGNPKGDDGLFGVAWDERTNDVWVDTNRDGSFADEKAMTDYRTRGDVGVFGKDDPATPIRESIGFAVQTDPKNKFVSINVGVYQHASMIMGGVIGNREPAGHLEGVAPGARLVSVYWGASGHGLVEGLITAFKHPAVDLIVLEQSVAVTSIPYTLADARHPISIVTQRLIDRYKKLVFVPGNNLPAFAFVAEDGLAPGAMSIGGYQSRESYRLNAGWVPEHEDNLHWGALSHGPSTAGALKPDILAPSGQISTDPGYRKGGGVKGLFQLPPGYNIGSGTSTATPTAAGATALVVSAAKQDGVAFDAVRLKKALTGSARFISTLAAHEQGNGLIQVGAAFDLLERLQPAPLVTIVTRAPVKHRLSSLLPSPDEGDGLYEREGWTVGDRRERTLTVTRTSGPADPMTFTLTWDGNDGTFSSPASVTLPLNAPVAVPLTVAAGKAGAHSALLTFDHPSIPGHAHRVLNTIVVPLGFSAANGYSVKTEITPPVPGDASVFVDVPAGAAALSVAVSPGVRLSFVSPTRDSRWRAPCPSEAQGGKITCSVGRPAPGVWEINVSTLAGRTFDPEAPAPIVAKPVTVTATIVDVGVEAQASVTAAIDSAQPVSLALRNRFGTVTAEAASAALGSAAQEQATIAQGEQHVYEVIVPEGATSIRAKVFDVGSAGADLDLYLLDCTAPQKRDEPPAKELEKGNKAPVALDPSCGVRAKADDVDGAGEVELPYPAPGRWVVVVDAFAVPGGRTDYRYLDVFTHPRFGVLAVADSPVSRAPSAAWTVKGSLWIASLPDAPRQLHARVSVTSGTIVEAVRTAEGFDLTGVRNVQLPIGALDLFLTPRGTRSAPAR